MTGTRPALSGADTPPILVLGSSVLLSGTAVLHALHSLQRGIQVTQSRDGISPPAPVRQLEQALRSAAEQVRMSPSRHGDVAQPSTLATWDPSEEELSTEEVAEMAALSTRQVERLATSFGARRVGRQYRYPRTAVEAAIAERAARRTP